MRTRTSMCETDAQLRKCFSSHFVQVISDAIGLQSWDEIQNSSFRVALRCSRYPWSRVLNRPGGTCQITLGGYTEEELERMRMRREAKNNTSANANTDTENQKKSSTNQKLAPEPKQAKESTPVVQKTTTQKPMVSSTIPSRRNGRISSNAFASSSTTNSYNVLTDRPTSRVSNPPGGRTNFTLG